MTFDKQSNARRTPESKSSRSVVITAQRIIAVRLLSIGADRVGIGQDCMLAVSIICMIRQLNLELHSGPAKISLSDCLCR